MKIFYEKNSFVLQHFATFLLISNIYSCNQQAIIHSKLTLETLGQGVTYVQS